VVEHFPGKHQEDLNSNPSTAKKRTKKIKGNLTKGDQLVSFYQLKASNLLLALDCEVKRV
jgi:hypothetical protein